MAGSVAQDTLVAQAIALLRVNVLNLQESPAPLVFQSLCPYPQSTPLRCYGRVICPLLIGIIFLYYESTAQRNASVKCKGK